MILHLTMLALAIVTPSDATGAVQPTEASRPITNPDWLSRPTGEDVARFYPARASQAGMAGQASISCRVNVEGGLEACVVTNESPQGWGFGEAAVKMAPSFRMKPKTVDGVPVADGKVVIPLSFRMMDGPPPPPTHGSVLVQCLALADGGLGSCAVVDEQPLGSGYAMPALRRAAEMRTPEGTAVGETVRLPMTFNGAPPEAPPPAPRLPSPMGSRAWWGEVLDFLFSAVMFVGFLAFGSLMTWLRLRDGWHRLQYSDRTLDEERDRKSMSALLGRD